MMYFIQKAKLLNQLLKKYECEHLICFFIINNIMMDCDIVYIVRIFYKTSKVDFIIQNILYFNQNNKVMLLLNIADYLYDKLDIEQLKKKYPNVLFYRCKPYRTKFDPMVVQCINNCFRYIVENINCKYIVLSHDSEVYVKQVDQTIIQGIMQKYKKPKFDRKKIEEKMESTFWWQRFRGLTNMFNYFIENQITPALDVCPGMTITLDSLKNIINDLNTLNTDYYLNHDKRVLLDEVIFHSLLTHYEGEYCNTNHTYWINEKREGLISEDETLNFLIEDLKNDCGSHLENKFSIKKSYKSVCEHVNTLMKN
jgi:hypothetical protein